MYILVHKDIYECVTDLRIFLRLIVISWFIGIVGEALSFR